MNYYPKDENVFKKENIRGRNSMGGFNSNNILVGVTVLSVFRKDMWKFC